MDLNDKLARRYFYLGNWEREVGEVLSKFLRKDMVFLDIGANIGIFSVLASGLVGARGRVFSFEPDPVNLGRLARNVSISRATNVVLNGIALMDKEGLVPLKTLAEDGWGQYSSVGEPLSAVVERGGLSGENVTHLVTCSTLDDYVEENEIKNIDLVKIDVEGAELSVLRGGERLLEKKTAPVLIIEFNRITSNIMGYDLDELRRHVESLGYTLYRLVEQGRYMTKLEALDIAQYENLVALKSEHSIAGLQTAQLQPKALAGNRIFRDIPLSHSKSPKR